MSNNPGIAQLDALVALVTESVNDFKSEFQKAGMTVPVLNVASSDEHDAMKGVASQKLNKATSIIEAACAQLTTLVVRPELSLVNASARHSVCACLQVASSRNIANLLLDTPEGQHVSKLSEACGLDADHLGRILRLLASNHIFQEVAPDVFANNMVSVKLATCKHTKSCVETRTKETFRATEFIADFLDLPVQENVVSPFQLAYGLPLMDYHTSPEGKSTVAKFMAGVTGWGEIAMISDISRSAFPWSDYFSKSNSFSICDVGAGEGHILLKLAKAYPGKPFRAIIQDRPSVLELSKKIWSTGNSEAIHKGLVEFVPIDFFTESPVEGCDIYYIRHCIHNWTDDRCVIILKNIAKAMRSQPDSILLIHEIVLRPALSNTSEREVSDPDTAPAPLLKNFGVAKFREFAADIAMMGLLNSKERTLDEYVTLGVKAGLAFDRLWSMEGCGLMQFKLA